ncbi:retrotransposon protein, putative, ty1-copia subclass [Tanacetum coccineum]
MKRGFLSQKGSGGGRGVKAKSSNASNIEVGKDGAAPSVSVDSGNVAKKVVSPFGVDECVAMEMQSSLIDTIGLESNPPLPTQVTSSAGNAPGKSSYANITGKPSGKKLNIRTLLTPGGNGIDVVVPVESIRSTSERFANTAYGFFLGKRVAYPVVANYVRNTCGSMDGFDAMLENSPWFIRNNPLILKKWHPNEYLLKEDVSTVPVWVKLHGVPVTAFSEDGFSAIATKLGTPLMLDSYTSDMCMQSWGRLSYARVMIELRADVELKDNIVVAMPKIKEEGAGEKQTLKKPSQTSRGIPVGSKMGFKPRQEYRHVPKKTTASSSGNKKKGEKPTIEVSNSNPFEVLNSVDNYEELGTNEETINLVNNDATSSGSSFMNIDNNSIGTTPIIDKIEKFENLVIDGQAILVDKAGNPLQKVVYPGDHDSEYEVASIDNDMARDLASERTGFGNQSLLEQLRDSYGNGDYDEDPYDDDMYEGQDLSE